jgi:hypothetical protein
MGDYFLAIVVIVGVPVYLYVLARIMASGIARSIYEVKREFSNQKKEVV